MQRLAPSLIRDSLLTKFYASNSKYAVDWCYRLLSRLHWEGELQFILKVQFGPFGLIFPLRCGLNIINVVQKLKIRAYFKWFLKKLFFGWVQSLMPAFTLQVRNSDGILIHMHRFSFLARMCFVAWNDNMEVVSNCCYVSLAANSPCIPGLKVWNSFLFLKNKNCGKRPLVCCFSERA